MKKFFIIAILVMTGLSVFAYLIKPNTDHPGKVELRWVTDDNPARRDQIALFNKTHPNINLSLDPGTNQKVVVQVLAGVGPDLFDVYSGQLPNYVKSDACLDVTDKLKAAGINVEKDVWRTLDTTYIYNGRVYGFPTNAACAGLMFNKDSLRKQGVPFPKGPWKWKDFLPVAQKLTVKDANGKIQQYGFMFEWSYFPMFSMQWGGHLYSPDGTRSVLNSPENAAAVQFMHDLIYKYHVTPTPNEQTSMASQGGWGAGMINLFGAGRAATMLAGRWMLCNLRNFEGLKVGAAELPYENHRVFWGYGRATTVNKYGKHKKEAFEFLKYLASTEYNELINHQADSIATMIRTTYTEKYLHDQDYPEEDTNAVWRDTMYLSKPYETSPFIEASKSDMILYKQLDLVRADQKTPEEALKTAQDLINEVIQRNIKKDPKLRELYDKLIRESRKTAK